MIFDHVEIDDLHKMVVELGGTVEPQDDGSSRIQLGGLVEFTNPKQPETNRRAKRFVAAWVLAERINQMAKKGKR
jgi:hypothetical protein